MISRLEGVVEQVNERLGNPESRRSRKIANLDRKADKGEVRLLFFIIATLLVAMIGLLGVVLANV